MFMRPMLKRGDRVRVCNVASFFKDGVGVIKRSSFKEGTGFIYVVEIGWEGQAWVNSFLEQELEKVE